LRACVGGASGEAAGPIKLVVGNEASDADSIVSALLYAYLLHEEALKAGGFAVPLVFCDRDDMTLRKETVLLLEQCGVRAEHLMFLNDPGICEELLPRVTEVVLVDHNRAVGPISSLDSKITTIIDHHKDLGSHAHIAGESRQIAFEGDQATAGSSCSLVAAHFLKSPAGKELLSLDSGAAALALLGVTLIDTVNMNPKAKKVTPCDVAAVRALEEHVVTDKTELFARLDAAKFDEAFWCSLSAEQCLRYDYKCFESAGKKYGLSSVLCPLESLAAKDGWEDAARRWASQVDLFGVLSNTKVAGDSPQRQLTLLASDEALTARAAEFAANYSEPALELEPMDLAGPAGLKAFRQCNSAASRKQVAPCLGAFFASL